MSTLGDGDNTGAEESKNSIPEYEESEDLDKYPFIFQFFGLPILVVGCKADLMPKHDAAAIRDARDAQAQIRGGKDFVCVVILFIMLCCESVDENQVNNSIKGNVVK